MFLKYNTNTLLVVIIVLLIINLIIVWTNKNSNVIEKLTNNNGTTLTTEAIGNITSVVEQNFITMPNMIVMYAGPENDIPTGWQLCDGTNNTPDLRGRFVLASGQGSGLTNRTLNQTGGEETVTLTIAQMPSHTHPATYRDAYNTSGKGRSGGSYWIPGQRSVTMSPTGGNQPHDNMPPYYVLAYIMKLPPT